MARSGVPHKRHHGCVDNFFLPARRVSGDGDDVGSFYEYEVIRSEREFAHACTDAIDDTHIYQVFSLEHRQNLSILTGAHVEQIVTDKLADGTIQATGALFSHLGQKQLVCSGEIVVCAGSVSVHRINGRIR